MKTKSNLLLENENLKMKIKIEKLKNRKLVMENTRDGYEELELVEKIRNLGYEPHNTKEYNIVMRNRYTYADDTSIVKLYINNELIDTLYIDGKLFGNNVDDYKHRILDTLRNHGYRVK